MAISVFFPRIFPKIHFDPQALRKLSTELFKISPYNCLLDYQQFVYYLKIKKGGETHRFSSDTAGSFLLLFVLVAQKQQKECATYHKDQDHDYRDHKTKGDG